MFNKKTQGLPLSVVVIAVIALMILIVLITIFSGRMGGFKKELKHCTCMPISECRVIDPDVACGAREVQTGERNWITNEASGCCVLEK